MTCQDDSVYYPQWFYNGSISAMLRYLVSVHPSVFFILRRLLGIQYDIYNNGSSV